MAPISGQTSTCQTVTTFRIINTNVRFGEYNELCIQTYLPDFTAVFNNGQSNINDVIQAHNTATIQRARRPVFKKKKL